MRESAHRGRPTDPGLQSRFIEAALELLEEEGYRALTTAAIAKRAGASTASLYRRWPTKQALVIDIARTLTVDALGDIDKGTIEGDLREFLVRKRELIARVGTPLIILLAESTSDEELRAILRPEVVDATTHHLGALLDRAAVRGALPAPSPETVRALSLFIVGSELVSQSLPAASVVDEDGIDVDAEVAMILRVVDAASEETPPMSVGAVRQQSREVHRPGDGRGDCSESIEERNVQRT